MRNDRDSIERLAHELAAAPGQPDERAFHEDLPALSSAALHRERERLRLALQLPRRPDPWVLQRLARIEYELSVRHGR